MAEDWSAFGGDVVMQREHAERTVELRAERDRLAAIVEVRDDLLVVTSANLAESRAEADRLRVIVDLACTAYTSEGLVGNFPYDEFDPLTEAVAAEVERRG